MCIRDSIYALDHHVGRLAEDHQHAKILADALKKATFVSSVMPVETNIVLFDIKPELKVEQVVKAFKDNGVLCNATSVSYTHLDVYKRQVSACT